MTLNKTFVRKLLYDVRPRCGPARADAMRHSFRNFHATGLDYINLLRTPALTLKLFVIERHRLVPGGVNGWVVNPHDHAYDFETWVLHGAVRHHVFHEVDGDEWCRFRYASPLNGERRLEFDGRIGLRPFDVHVYEAGEGYALESDVVHTIEHVTAAPLVLFLAQHRDQPVGHTTLYLPDETPPAASQLYQPFENDDAFEAAVDRALSLIKD